MGTPEKAFLVEHDGSPGVREAIEAQGRKYGQQSVLHSSNGQNELADLIEGDRHKGSGFEWPGPDQKDRYTELPGGANFRPIVPDQDLDLDGAVKKSLFKSKIKEFREKVQEVKAKRFIRAAKLAKNQEEKIDQCFDCQYDRLQL